MHVLRRRRRDDASGRWASAVLLVARVSHGQWFFVNLYEAVVRMPDRLADEHDSSTRQDSRGPLGRGSPARYHLPVAPVVISSAWGAAAATTTGTPARKAAVVAAGSSLAATALTGYIVRTVNLRLLDDGSPIDPDERRRLVARWHTLNRARLALLAVATVGFEHASGRGDR